MANTYTTVQGDTWDKIGYETLGSEYLLPLLLEENSKYRSVVVFSGGITLSIPDVDTAEITDRPDWLGEYDEDEVAEVYTNETVVPVTPNIGNITVKVDGGEF